jgi:hypothetical protein
MFTHFTSQAQLLDHQSMRRRNLKSKEVFAQVSYRQLGLSVRPPSSGCRKHVTIGSWSTFEGRKQESDYSTRAVSILEGKKLFQPLN